MTTAANAVVDGNRSVTLTLSSPTGTSAMLGATPGATVNILDEDRTGLVKLSAANYSVAETGKNALITIVRTGTNLAANVSVQFTISDGTALAGRDYALPALPSNTSVTFTGTPAKVASSIAASPCSVPGILMNTFSRPARACSSTAARTLPAVS